MDREVDEVKRQPEVIFFDAAGTLIHLVKGAGWHYAEMARRHGWAEADEERFEAAFRAVWKKQAAREPEAGGRVEDDRPWWRGLAFSVLEALEGWPAGFDREAWFAELYGRFAEPGVWALYEDARPCLERLSGKVRLGVLSNFDRRLRRILEDLGVAGMFEAMFISSEVGAEKPAREIFQRAVSAMGVEPGACLHVGDDPKRDWEGARQAGLRVFCLERGRNGLDEVGEGSE